MGLKLGIFGTFFPEYNFVGNCTTAIACGLAETVLVDRVTVFCQNGSSIPEFVNPSVSRKLTLKPCWRHDSPLSILQAALRVLKEAKNFDAILFNTYVTAYGRSYAANALGLLLPTVVALGSRTPTTVYMHNFVETQEVESLGYSPSLITKKGVRVLERSLLSNTSVIVPLADQAQIVELTLGVRPKVFFFPYLESYLVAKSAVGTSEHPVPATPGKKRILLMGVWGPQKDLAGALEALASLGGELQMFDITVAGGANPHFPLSLRGLGAEKYPALQGHIRFTGPLSDEDLYKLVRTHDILVLPYHATGGYSGVMNFASIAGIPIVAYDHDQLREEASVIGADVTFVSPKDLSTGIKSVLRRVTGLNRLEPSDVSRHVERTAEALEQFVGILLQTRRREHGREKN